MTIQNISDTARWVAIYRARETERPDALFHDPLARRLAGERGEEIITAMKSLDKNAWAFVMRTYLFDQFIEKEIAGGVDMVVNLAAGLDARPYRMTLPPTLKWVEVDLPELIAYKEETLRGETPVCAIERVGLDLADVDARRALFTRLGAQAKKVLIVSEGLIIYLTADGVRSLADDLADEPSFQRWIVDIASPALVKMIQGEIGKQLGEARAALQFGPEEGVEFFAPSGWRAVEVKSPLKTAAAKKRVGLLFRLIAMLPEPKRPGLKRPWSGVCLLART